MGLLHWVVKSDQPSKTPYSGDAQALAALKTGGLGNYHTAVTDEWASVYTFACLRMDRFVHGRVIFAGDSAHGVSPFGARGANSGVQDAENLAWKLDAVLKGRAGAELLPPRSEHRAKPHDQRSIGPPAG